MGVLTESCIYILLCDLFRKHPPPFKDKLASVLAAHYSLPVPTVVELIQTQIIVWSVFVLKMKKVHLFTFNLMRNISI